MWRIFFQFQTQKITTHLILFEVIAAQKVVETCNIIPRIVNRQDVVLVVQRIYLLAHPAGEIKRLLYYYHHHYYLQELTEKKFRRFLSRSKIRKSKLGYERDEQVCCHIQLVCRERKINKTFKRQKVNFMAQTSVAFEILLET